MGCFNSVKVIEEKFKGNNYLEGSHSNRSDQTNLSSLDPESIQNNFNKENLLKIHNTYRKKHKSPELILNDELNKIADKYAKDLCETNNEIFLHKTFNSEAIGENIYFSENNINGEKIIEEWYEESQGYDYKKDFQKDKIHFSQLIWKSSKFVGFGVNYNDEKFCFVTLYSPAGNIIGKYKKNVEKE